MNENKCPYCNQYIDSNPMIADFSKHKECIKVAFSQRTDSRKCHETKGTHNFQVTRYGQCNCGSKEYRD